MAAPSRTLVRAMLLTDISIIYVVAAWYEWLPDISHDFTGISFSPGDVVTIEVVAHSRTSGLAVIENHTKNQSVQKELTSTHALCQSDAEWIVEDFTVIPGGLVPFANFGTVAFTGLAQKNGGGFVNPSANPQIWTMVQNGQTLARTSVSGQVVTVSHT